MNIYVDFSNKDLVKKLGCKWNKEENKWQCHHDNSDINIKKLIQHQKDGVLCFITQFISKHNVDKHPSVIAILLNKSTLLSFLAFSLTIQVC